MNAGVRRLILADTQELHKQITRMSNRIHQLEEALAILQATVSSDIHPLLSNSVKFDTEVTPAEAKDPNIQETDISIAEALGKLAISESGIPKYYGPGADGFEDILLGV